MKRIIICLSFAVIAIFVSHNVILEADAEEYSEQVSVLYRDSMWQLGKSLAVGDSYTYKICDPGAIPDYSAENYHYFTGGLDHNSSLCYVVKMDFANLLSSGENQQNRDVWVVQESISDVLDDFIIRAVLHVDAESFDVRSAGTTHPDTLRYAQSIEDTLFSILKYAKEPKMLKVDSEWGSVTESLGFGPYPYMTVKDENLEYHAIQNVINYINNTASSAEKILSDVYEVGYDIDIVDSDDVATSYLVSSDIPFPLSGVKYSPVHIIKPFKVFEFELLSYSLQNITQNDLTTTSDTDEIILPDDSANNIENVQDFPNDTTLDVTDDAINDSANTDTIIDDKVTDDANQDPDVTENQDMINIKHDMDDVFVDDTDTVQNINDENAITEDDNSDDAKNNVSAYSLIGITIYIVAIFVYFKIYKIHTSKKPYTKAKRTLEKTIHFDDALTIDIKTKKNTGKISALKTNERHNGENK